MSRATSALLALIATLGPLAFQGSIAVAGKADARDAVIAGVVAATEDHRRLMLASDGPEKVEALDQAARRRQELDELSRRLQRAEERRAGKTMPDDASPSRLGSGAAPDIVTEARPPAQDRVAVLLVMAPGNKGIRRFIKSADPVLCAERSCFVSRGVTETAMQMSQSRALGIANTFGSRAGACSDSLGCVYRGVPFDLRTRVLQPVDLRLVSHDKREAHLVAPDRTCRLEAAGLVCDGAIKSADYTMWIVPEMLAEKAGPVALKAAVANGLGSGRVMAAKVR